MIGTKIGNYCVTKQIGEGGMGAVYQAKHTLLDKLVAVKVLLPQYSSNEEVVSRFFNEAKATTMVNHPGIVELYDFGNLEDGRAYIVMELLVGESLDARLASPRHISIAEAARITSRIAGIMRAAHSHDIVHRDLKPENIILVPDPGVEEKERPKVLDFGIAKLNDESIDDKSKVKTRTGSIIGSPLYMSPEQCRGAGQVDYRSDIYSLGCILFELLCGQPPFDGEGTGEIIGAHLHVKPEHPKSLVPSVPQDLGDIVMKALAKDPADRFQSMEEFAQGLRKHCSSETAAVQHSPGIGLGEQPAIETPVPPSPHTETNLGQGPALALPGIGAAKNRSSEPTTLGLSTEPGATPTKEGRAPRTPLLTILAIGAVAAAGLSYYQLSQSNDDSPRVLANAVEPAGVTVTAKAPVLKQGEVTLHIESLPSGAAIHRADDDLLLGYAPLDLTKPQSDTPLQLLLRHPGHSETQLELSLRKDANETVTLGTRQPETARVDPIESTGQNSTPGSKMKAKAKAAERVRAKAKAGERARARAKAAAKEREKAKTAERVRAKAKAAAKEREKAKAAERVRAKAKAAAKEREKAKAKAKSSPLTQPNAKTKRAGDGALDPFNR